MVTVLRRTQRHGRWNQLRGASRFVEKEENAPGNSNATLSRKSVHSLLEPPLRESNGFSSIDGFNGDRAGSRDSDRFLAVNSKDLDRSCDSSSSGEESDIAVVRVQSGGGGAGGLDLST